MCAAGEETCTGATHWLCRRFQRSAFMEPLCAGGAHTGSGADFSTGQFEVCGQGFQITYKWRVSIRWAQTGGVSPALAF
jgi:hypothetical protein